MTISWGTNTVHTFSSPSPVAPTFGAAAGGSTVSFGGTPAPAPSFGSSFGAPTPAPAFGASPAPTPAFGGSTFGAPAPSGGLFGSTSGGLFGSTTPAPSGGLFGSSPAPAPGGSLFGGSSAFGGSSTFGAPSPGGLFGSSFGTPAPSSFGAPHQQQQPPQPQVPAQAALQAHMEAMNAAETHKIKAELSKLYAIYTGEVTPSTASDAKKNFVSIVYNDLTQEQRQLQWLHGMGADGKVMPLAPPKPPQLSEEDWYKAVVTNPDPMNYMPVALVGADALSARLAWQQERATELAKHVKAIETTHETSKEVYQKSYRHIEKMTRDHANTRQRLLNIMRKLEVVRCMNLPLQPDEVLAMGQLRDMSLKVQDLKRQFVDLESQVRKTPQISSTYFIKDGDIPDRERLSHMFMEHAEEIKKLNATLTKDVRDVDLIKHRVMPKEGLPFLSR